MKRSFILLITVATTTFMTSCKKNHVCECIYTDGDIDTYNIVNQKKSDAKNICAASSSSSKVCSLN